MKALGTISTAAAALLVAATPAQAVTVNIAGNVTGCSTCNGSPHPAPGDTLGTLINPVLQTFGPGTYTVTNAFGTEGALYDAWNFNLGSSENWIWSFIIADASNNKVVLDSLVPQNGAFVGTHNAVAGSSYALNYSGTFTLTQSTQLAFLTEDYFPQDNLGGVSLNVQLARPPQVGAVPEPASWAMLLTGFTIVGGAMRRRRVLSRLSPA